MTRCLHCGKDVVQRGDGTLVHKGTRLQLCAPLARTVATPSPEPETKEESHG